MPEMTKTEAILEAGRMQAAATIVAALVTRDPNQETSGSQRLEQALHLFDAVLGALHQHY